MLLLSILMLFNFSSHADSGKNSPIYIRSISLFRNEIQLGLQKPSEVKVGTKISARTAVNHKCLLIVTRVVKDLAYADATQCPGYATLKKGQLVSITQENEVNEEVKAVKQSEES